MGSYVLQCASILSKGDLQLKRIDESAPARVGDVLMNQDLERSH